MHDIARQYPEPIGLGPEHRQDPSRSLLGELGYSTVPQLGGRRPGLKRKGTSWYSAVI